MNPSMPTITPIEWEAITELYCHEWNPEEDLPVENFERLWDFVHPDGTWTELFTVAGCVMYHLHVYDSA